jgi:hypothetical protein
MCDKTITVLYVILSQKSGNVYTLQEYDVVFNGIYDEQWEVVMHSDDFLV